jgi:hypothetical protein
MNCECVANSREDWRYRRVKHLMLGVALICMGIVYALASQGMFGLRTMWDVVPAVIALTGIARIVTARRGRHIVKGVFRLGFAAWLYVCIEQAWGLSFAKTWPFVVILLGACMLLRGLIDKESPNKSVAS